jgi:hypothetical protein
VPGQKDGGGTAVGGANGEIDGSGTASGGTPPVDGSVDAGSGGCSAGSCGCASSRALDRAALDIYVLFDASLSMNDATNGGTKWEVIKAALTEFVQSPTSAGLQIGLGYFPFAPPAQAPTTCQQDSDCGQYGPCLADATTGLQRICKKTDSCIADNYAPDVSISPLPAVATTIVNSLGAHGPTGFTPTYPALQATYAYLASFAKANPSDQTVLVLSTDGDPTTCDASTNNVGAIATNLVAPARAASIPTFVVGVGSSLSSLNQIAAAGGTEQAFIIDTRASDAGGQYLDAMTSIARSGVLACQYRFPTLSSGGPADLAAAELELTPAAGATITLHPVATRAACTAQAGGWFVDDPASPSRITLCDSTCVAIAAGAGATARLLLGCGH